MGIFIQLPKFFDGLSSPSMKDKILSVLKRLPEVTRYTLVIGVILALSFLFPSYLRFNYDFEEGKPWMYKDLYAPFDFAIQKEQAEIKAKLDSIKSQLEPYYKFEEQIVNNGVEAFEQALEKKVKSEQGDNATFKNLDINALSDYQRVGRRLIRNIYENGIVKLTPQHFNRTDSASIIIIKRDKQFREKMFSLVDRSKAFDILSDSLSRTASRGDFLSEIFQNNYQAILQPNVLYSDSLTEVFNELQINAFSTGRGMVKENERIVSNKEIVTPNISQKLLSLQNAYEERTLRGDNFLGFQIGYFILTTFILILFIVFLKIYYATLFNSFQKLLFIFMWILLYSYLTYWIDSTNLVSLYAVPFCIVPIVIKNFYDGRIALFTHVITILIISYLAALGYEFVFTQIIAGIVVVIATVKTRYWSNFFFSIIYIFLTYNIVFFGLALIQEGNWAALPWETAIWIFVNAFLILLAYPLVPLLERVFGFTSEITLVELSNLDNPLLKEMSIKANGTLQHSLQVANLAEAAAFEIGANALLVKVAALYHDIGKITQPQFFIENQKNNNPHDNLSPLDSANIIIDHVAEGVRLAKKNGLPKVLIDFISTHHGTTKVEFFYRNYVKANPDAIVDEQLFRYIGPAPRTKEEMILMLADSIEAASKSLKNPTSDSIDELVENIIRAKIDKGQFVNTALTFKELEAIKKVFKNLLKSINHVRIPYPEEVKNNGKT